MPYTASPDPRQLVDNQQVRGIRNTGHSCYANSVLQCLLTNKELVRFMAVYLDIYNTARIQATDMPNGEMVEEFRTFVIDYLSDNLGYLMPNNLQSLKLLYFFAKNLRQQNIQWPLGQQHDAREFVQYMLDFLDTDTRLLPEAAENEQMVDLTSDNLNTDPNADTNEIYSRLIHNCYYWSTNSYSHCTNCGHDATHANEEKGVIFPVSVPDGAINRSNPGHTARLETTETRSGQAESREREIEWTFVLVSTKDTAAGSATSITVPAISEHVLYMAKRPQSITELKLWIARQSDISRPNDLIFTEVNTRTKIIQRVYDNEVDANPRNGGKILQQILDSTSIYVYHVKELQYFVSSHYTMVPMCMLHREGRRMPTTSFGVPLLAIGELNSRGEVKMSPSSLWYHQALQPYLQGQLENNLVQLLMVDKTGHCDRCQNTARTCNQCNLPISGTHSPDFQIGVLWKDHNEYPDMVVERVDRRQSMFSRKRVRQANVATPSGADSASHETYSVAQCIQWSFRLTRVPEYVCPNCHLSSTTDKYYRFNHVPPYLIMCVKRFTNNNTKLENVINTDTSINNLDLNEFMVSSSAQAAENRQYKLMGVVNHLGNQTTSGHYTALVRHVRGLYETWYKCDDDRTPEVWRDGTSSGNSYLLFYELVT